MDHANEHSEMGYEKSDADFLKIVVIAFVLIAILLGLVVGVHELFFFLKERAYQKAVLESPNVEIMTIREAADQRLSTYGELEGVNGRYHIPIERAMELVVKEKN